MLLTVLLAREDTELEDLQWKDLKASLLILVLDWSVIVCFLRGALAFVRMFRPYSKLGLIFVLGVFSKWRLAANQTRGQRDSLH